MEAEKATTTGNRTSVFKSIRRFVIEGEGLKKDLWIGGGTAVGFAGCLEEVLRRGSKAAVVGMFAVTITGALLASKRIAHHTDKSKKQ